MHEIALATGAAAQAAMAFIAPSEPVLRHPPSSSVQLTAIGFIVRVPGSAGVVLDDSLLRLWQWADGRTESELQLLPLFQDDPSLDVEVLALRQARLLLPAIEKSTAENSARLIEPLPLVSVIIVTHDGWMHLRDCLPSLLAQTYPHIEILVIDDRSGDETACHLSAQFPSVRVIRQTNGPNFAAGCNLGIRHARGDLIFLLNNDTLVDPNCVRELVAAFVRQEAVGGVAAQMRFYDNPAFINGLGSYIPPGAHGYDLAIGSLDVGQFDAVAETPFLCFGAALVSRQALDTVGLLDERYQFYYEDADWSYRARRRGLKLIAAPRALVYHKFGASIGALPSAFKTRLVTRNRLRFSWRNAPWHIAIRQSVHYGQDDAARIVKHLIAREADLSAALLRGWLEFGVRLPALLRQRSLFSPQNASQRVDLSNLAAPFPPPALQGTYPCLTRVLVESRYARYLAEARTSPSATRVLIISPDVVDVNMGGVGMRYWELASAMARQVHVTLAVPNSSRLKSEDFGLMTYAQGNSESLRPLVDASDVVMLSGFSMYHHPFLRALSKPYVVDLYDPTMFENLHLFADRTLEEQHALHRSHMQTYQELLGRGDFFICGSEKQRDFWLGALTLLNRVDPTAYAADPTLRRLIDVVPPGIPDAPPRSTAQVLKGVYPGISEDDQVILWGGGLWDWLDPLTAIEAMPQILRHVPKARLFFMGTRHPNAAVPASRIAERAIARASALGLNDRSIFFHDWVPYQERANFLLGADVGISLHTDHIETRFAVRTRLMDYLWASLPMVVSSGDALSELVKEYGLGRIIRPGAVTELAEALIDVLAQPPPRERFVPVQAMFRWSSVAEPLQRYLQSARRTTAYTLNPTDIPPAPITPFWKLPSKAARSLRMRGVKGLWNDVRSYLAWRF